MADVPLWPSLVAVIVAEPATFAVTSPVPVTVATGVLVLAHVTVRPVRMLPVASRRVAVSCCVWPAGTLADAGLTVTDATGTPLTVMLAVPLWPSLVAVMVTAPATTPVTSPLLLTVAISWSSRSEEHTSELQSLAYLVCRLLLEKKKKQTRIR